MRERVRGEGVMRTMATRADRVWGEEMRQRRVEVVGWLKNKRLEKGAAMDSLGTHASEFVPLPR